MSGWKTCGRKLAPGQWWHTCGETDMGQTMPAQCGECAAPEPGYTLADPDAPAPTRAQDDATHGRAQDDAKLGALVRATMVEYSLTSPPKLDADGFEQRTRLGDALRRDAMSTLLRTAREQGLI
jgi:hypothetical protein